MLLDLLDVRNGEAYDCGSGPATRTLVVASTPRCGSTMFCRTLWETGMVGAPKEYFNPTQRRDWMVRSGSSLAVRLAYGTIRGPLTAGLGRLPWSTKGLTKYTRTLQAHRTGTQGWFSTKLHWHHFERIFARAGREPSDVFGDVTWVLMTRSDRLAQAVSWARALQTQRWAARQSERRSPTYSRSLIARAHGWIEDGEAGWEDWFAQRGVVPTRVVYEDFVAAHASETCRVLGELGIVFERERVAAPPMGIQRDEISARWCARYRATG